MPSRDMIVDMIVDMIRTIARHGPRRFFVLNTGVSTLRSLAPAGTHADELETSTMLYMHPEVVHMRKAVARKDAYSSTHQCSEVPVLRLPLWSNFSHWLFATYTKPPRHTVPIVGSSATSACRSSRVTRDMRDSESSSVNEQSAPVRFCVAHPQSNHCSRQFHRRRAKSTPPHRQCA